MGIAAEVEKAFEFTYRADMENGLTEHEYDHVFVGRYNGAPKPNTEEVCDWRYVSKATLTDEVHRNPEKFTPWFRMLFERVASHYAAIAGVRQQLK
jgi:isopentenyl-diphosphate delta-isomerase